MVGVVCVVGKSGESAGWQRQENVADKTDNKALLQRLARRTDASNPPDQTCKHTILTDCMRIQRKQVGAAIFHHSTPPTSSAQSRPSSAVRPSHSACRSCISVPFNGQRTAILPAFRIVTQTGVQSISLARCRLDLFGARGRTCWINLDDHDRARPPEACLCAVYLLPEQPTIIYWLLWGASIAQGLPSRHKHLLNSPAQRGARGWSAGVDSSQEFSFPGRPRTSGVGVAPR
ncbi:uncharacterized protein J3D65DRAFT_448219 [Phyllosticta citribraziliensis]|uniref:Uncharacterized protein n=1 Tax=Phyllosticta citribraziliensis TaxID=989973 RepID=A0ABR1LJD9_9PEZI